MERKDGAGGSSEVTSDKTWCLQAWRQAGFMPLDKQAVAERALKLGRGTQAVAGGSFKDPSVWGQASFSTT